jgi:hypothetical protein
MDQRRLMVAVGRPRHEARRIARKHLCERLCDIFGEYVLLNAIPDVEYEASIVLEDSLSLPIDGHAFGQEHDAELAADDIERGGAERQCKGVRLSPRDPVVGRLPLRGMVEHRLIEVGRHITSSRRKLWRERTRDDPAARGGLQNRGRAKAATRRAMSSAKPAKMSGTK